MARTPETLRVVGYARCSTTEQATEGMSLDAQAARIRAWCDAMGADLIEIIVDAGVSGTKPLADRPGGAKIVDLLSARQSDVDAVVIVRLDRLGRDAAETLAYLRRFRTSRLGLISIVDRVDLGTPQGRAMAQMSAVFAELERALLGQRTSEALAEKRRQGRVYGPTPFGLRRTPDGRLVADRKEQGTLRRIRELRADGLGYARVAAALNTEKRPSKKGGPWAAMSVRSVLLTSEAATAVLTGATSKS
jgi:site-specific DNA recombinase